MTLRLAGARGRPGGMAPYVWQCRPLYRKPLFSTAPTTEFGHTDNRGAVRGGAAGTVRCVIMPDGSGIAEGVEAAGPADTCTSEVFMIISGKEKQEGGGRESSPNRTTHRTGKTLTPGAALLNAFVSCGMEGPGAMNRRWSAFIKPERASFTSRLRQESAWSGLIPCGFISGICPRYLLE